MQTLFTCLITLQLIVVISHDLVNIPGWTHGNFPLVPYLRFGGA
jgi:hypothetical protein